MSLPLFDQSALSIPALFTQNQGCIHAMYMIFFFLTLQQVTLGISCFFGQILGVRRENSSSLE